MDKKILILSVLSFILNCIFLYFYNPHYYYAISQLHGQIGYNINVFNSIDINTDFAQHMNDQVIQKNCLIDYNSLKKNQFSAPKEPFPVNDTIGYGLILGLLWKITDSFKFIDVQILQILISILLLPIIYHCALLLFNNAHIALLSCIALLFYFPLYAMNVQPVRDIWAFYGVVLLLYSFLMYFYGTKSVLKLILCSIGFALCQIIRPSVFFALLIFLIVILMYAVINTLIKPLAIRWSLIFLSANILCFWIPFITYNITHYNRFLVGPAGQDLLEGLGEFKNPWGFQLSDAFVNDYISKKYHLLYGTPEFDDKAKEEFMIACQQKPHLFFINICKRIPSIILPALPWIYYESSPYHGISWYEKIKEIINNHSLLIDFIIRHFYIRLYLFIGYIGLFLMLRKKLYGPAIILLATLVGGLGKLPSHIEYRYIVPFYWIFAFFVGYALYEIKNKLGINNIIKRV